MSRRDLHKAARDVLSAWDHYGTAECLRGWIDRLRDALATDLPAPSAEQTTECTTCGAIVVGVAEPSEPIASVTGVHAGRTVVEPINRAMVLPVGMALYAHPAPALPAAAVEAMRMALEALEQTSDWIFKSDQPEAAKRLRQRAIDTLRAQIGQIGGGR
jgi:hypothetical protein